MKKTFVCFCICGFLVVGLLFGLSSNAGAGAFFDDFNDGNADGWVFPYNHSTSQGPGLWSVENGNLVQRFAGDNNTGLVDNLLISDQVIESQVRTGGYAGVVFWYQQVNDNAANYVAVSHNYQAGMWVLEMVDGIGTIYSYYGPWIGNDTFYGLRVVADSVTGNLAVFLDNAYLFTHLTNTPYRTGMSGVYSGNDVGYFDNFRLTYDIPPIPISIDIKPGSDLNSINLKSNGVVPVAILSTIDFEATAVDPGTVLFADASSVKWTMEDVNRDGDLDLLLHFRTQDLNLTQDSAEATLTGKTIDGTTITGTDTVNIVPKKKK